MSIYKHLTNVHTVYTIRFHVHRNTEITTRLISVLETSRSRRGKGAYKIVRDRTATQKYEVYKTESKRKRPVSHRASLFSYLVLRRIVFSSSPVFANHTLRADLTSLSFSGYFFILRPRNVGSLDYYLPFSSLLKYRS